MSKARLVITAVLIEGRSQSQVARDYGVCQSWISRLIARYTLGGDAAFEPRSRRPHTSPTRLPQATIDLIVALRTELADKGLDASPRPSPSTCNTTTTSQSPSLRSAESNRYPFPTPQAAGRAPGKRMP